MAASLPILVLSALAAVPAQAAPTFERAEKCGECHSGIHSEWKDSMHAQSIVDPIFQGVFKDVTDPSDRRYCLSCHAPVTQANGDFSLKQAITQEGITCDFCHSIVSVLPATADLRRFELQPGETKRGPFKPEELTEKGHQNGFSPLHKDSSFCGGCHEVVNRHGFHVMSTYTEWKEGPYPVQSIMCQNCHMPEDIRFPIVDPSIIPSNKTVTSHSVMGGHSQIRLGNAATVSLLVDAKGAGADVVAYVTNSESGHALPTGIPARKVVLTTRLLDEDGKVLESKDVEYRRILKDTAGKEIPNLAVKDMFLEAAGVISDNRIRPKETRRETFRFDRGVSKGAAWVEAVLHYEFVPPMQNGSRMKFMMAQDKVPLEHRPTIGRIWKIILIVSLVATAVWIFRKSIVKQGGAG